MDTSDRSPGALAPWSAMPPATRPTLWDAPEAAPSSGPSFSPKVILRAIRRHWWQILAIWLVGSAAAVAVIYAKVLPKYQVFSLIEVEPASKVVLAPSAAGSNPFEAYLKTQEVLITSPDVLSGALREPGIAGLPKIRESLDPESELLEEIKVSPRKGTNVIEVALSDTNAAQAADIVNAVVKSYMERARNWTAQEISAQVQKLHDQSLKFEADVTRQREVLRSLSKKAAENPDVNLVQGAPVPEKDKEAAPASRSRITPEEFGKLEADLIQATVQRLQAEAAVDSFRQEMSKRPRASAAAPLAEDRLEQAVRDAFLDLPEVARLKGEMGTWEAKLANAERKIRNPLTDPASKHCRDQLAALDAEYLDLWEQMYPRLKQQLRQAPAAQPDAEALSLDAELREAMRNLTETRIRESFLQEHRKAVEVEVRNANNDIIDVQFAQEDLTFKMNLSDTVHRHLEQLEMEQQNSSRIKLRAKARANGSPSSNSRLKLMLGAPVGMLLMATGLFVLLEIRGARVGDPEELSQRVRLGVIGVVPPLPSLGTSPRALSARGQRDEKRRIEEFVHSLDQLRVTLCAPRPGMATHRRCVLITSATGGEGKTTLAAQLAGRCAHAGLLTLLIDADLRRPSLGDLLEVPEGPGLVDVLSGEANPEDAMVVIGNAGGFHLLPAGTAGRDPSRLLHGERLGPLIAQLRESFDIVIIDAPPVLAVPDALLLGRWTDGAVLAVRHDTSRFPLVERANSRLASVGVTVLGAVVNGCRSMESAYGSYRYSPYAAAEAPEAGPPPHDV